MTLLHASLDHLGLLLHRLRNGVQGQLHLVLLEQAEQAPPAGTAAILVLGLGVVRPLVDHGGAHGVLAQVGLGHAVARQDGALATLFIVDDERDCDLGGVGPFQRWQAGFAIAFEVAGEVVVWVGVVGFGHFGLCAQGSCFAV